MKEETENWAGTGGDALDRWADDTNLADHLVYRHLREGRGGNLALLYRDAALSYAEVAQRVQSAAAVLHRCGVRPGQTVVLLMPDTPAFVAAFFGALAVGAVAVPVNPALNASDVDYVLSQVRPRVVVLDSALIAKFKSLKDKNDCVALVAGDLGERFADFEERMTAVVESPAVVKRAGAIAYCAFSSGTTGLPKGIPHRHTDILHCAAAYARPVLGMSHGDRALAVPKLCFGYGLGGNLLASFLYGGTATLIPETSTARTMAEAVARYRPTLVLATPRILSEWLQSNQKLDLASVRLIVSAGELLVPALYERWRSTYDVEVLDGFGSTEMGHIFISNRRGDVRAGSSGRVLPGFEVKIVDDNFAPVPPGTVGQMLARGASALTEYWNDPDRTRKGIRDGWIVTGDLFTQDAAGYLYPCGRADDMIKAGCGHWISPQDLENVLLRHEAVGDCAVVGSSDADGLVRPKAYVVLKRGIRASEEIEQELRSLVVAAWPELEYKHLGAVEFASDLPRSASGKLQRSRLKPNTLTEYSYEC